jgi:DNA-binding transcriptional LysR family regulator
LLYSLGDAAEKTPPPANSSVSTLASIVVQSVHAPLERTVDGTIEAVNQATVSAQTAGRLIPFPGASSFLLSVFRSESIEPRIGYRVSSIEMVVGMVANELGVSVLVTKPAYLRAYDGKQVASRPLARTRIRQSVVLAHAARSTLTMPALALAQCIREQFTKG